MISIAPFINHLLAQESWARKLLLPHAGEIACIDAEIIQIRLLVSVDGLLSNAEASAPANVTIRIRPADIPLILQRREQAFSYVRIDGDADFANTISTLSQQLRWEAEADLSRIVGDIAAVRMVDGVRSAITYVQQAHQQLQENLAEYFLDENPLLVRPAEVQEFAAGVNKTRDDVERLLKRMEKIEKQQKVRS
ncbi:ubiquinone biosynthesis accessory factor UbiJ [Undibacterium oligocarboniphilum]|uniref:Ubiquinone biosynthesis accessory factor UbiJ n=1 Tax=Undibacterium oligocarboniphilum TaxID=666702 RepID=A0A850QQI7_9BURK|nr:sterol-binding protein [Undibacterium oligocarboniphilum]MBC3870545.1 sterol-binding protein [Undibacterium oligocarboniphilum]NVO78654.1 sterol-binding protein [Undibacterium oligocarboniphilum]